ncbi:hypothetical protein DPMN_136675 [Dreissena polymorpha]|uniref:Uncharacterized protein n=2 Tax=Dreissena polymorpha TaxID=45954 RepID=A0A9D4G6B4_DREPO|nr:hypothetical protein DPMN_136675 [Dreissena polymorpha]
MLPPCENPVFGPGNCCGSCPEPDTTPVANPSATHGEPGVTINHLPSQNNAGRFRRIPYVRRKANPKPVKRTAPPTTTQNPPTTTEPPPTTTTTQPTTIDCPYPCTYYGQHYCHLLPCHITCVDAVRPPGACCYECPNGPNCMYQGTVIPEGQNATVDGGEVVFCSSGDLFGGSVIVYPVPEVVG